MNLSKIATLLCTLAALLLFASGKRFEGCQPSCPILSANPNTLCPTASGQLSVTGAAAGSTFSFSTTNGIISSSSGPNAQILGPGTYRVQICRTLSVTVPVGNNCPPVGCPSIGASLTTVSGASSATICNVGPNPSFVVLQCSANPAINPTGLQYTFYRNNQPIITSSSSQLRVNFGDFTGALAEYTCAVRTSNTCISTRSPVVTVFACSTAPPPSTPVCPTSPSPFIRYTGSCQSGSYIITSNISNSGSGQTYSFTLFTSTDLGNSFTPSAPVNVVGTGGPISASFTVATTTTTAIYYVQVTSSGCLATTTSQIAPLACP